MEQITYKEFRNFLDSEVDEAEYFGCNKDNLITMKEYLLNLKERFEMCEHKISSDKDKIQEKYKHISRLSYNDNYWGLTFNIGDSSYYLKKDEEKDIYKVHWYASCEPSIFTNMKLIRHRNMGRKFSKEIDNIIECSKRYFYKDNIINSVSSIFTLKDYYNSSSLNCNDTPFFYIDKKTLVPSKNTISPFVEKLSGDKELNIQDKQKLLTKIMVPRGFLN